MPIILWTVGSIMALVFVFVIISVVVNASRARRAGHNPLTMQTDIATKLLDSDALSSQPSVEALRKKTERLHSAVIITGDEYGARARLLAHTTARSRPGAETHPSQVSGNRAPARSRRARAYARFNPIAEPSSVTSWA